MLDIGFVATWYNHGWAVTVSHVGQRQQNVNLSASELPIMVTKLSTYTALARA